MRFVRAAVLGIPVGVLAMVIYVFASMVMPTK